ncbi:MAG: FAD-binding oxidoreductase [Bryobacteraceae bacterium]
MRTLNPSTREELAAALAEAAASKTRIQIEGARSKARMGGAVEPAGAVISTLGLHRLLEYEPADLTISVEAGMRWAELQKILSANNQTVPLDPPFYGEATVGGVLAANTCGPRRRLYGGPRDAVIGMKFVTLEGVTVQSGGMVVKNVAGLDIGKLMIGSFGTLAAIVVANFKLTPVPPVSRTFLFHFQTADAALAGRDRILGSVLQPAALDILNPHAATRVGGRDWVLAVQASGNQRVIERYTTEFEGADRLDGDAETAFWSKVREFTPDFLAGHPDGAVARFSATIQGVAPILQDLPVPAVCRAGNGIVYGYFPDVEAAAQWLPRYSGVLEFIPPRSCSPDEQWPNAGSDLAVMQKVKQMFDPHYLLNRGRLYGRI